MFCYTFWWTKIHITLLFLPHNRSNWGRISASDVIACEIATKQRTWLSSSLVIAVDVAVLSFVVTEPYLTTSTINPNFSLKPSWIVELVFALNVCMSLSRASHFSN
jgi:hypothetical protein